MRKLENKVAIITGAASGIGLATAHLFAQEGARLALVDRNEMPGEHQERLRKEANGVLFLHGDVTKSRDWQKIVRETTAAFERIDILVNNAGVDSQGPVHEVPEEEFDRVIAINLKGTFLGCKYVIPTMLSQGGGVIVNMGSGAGVAGGADIPVYSASKGGVVMLTKAMALDYSRNNIRVNCVCPGFTKTPMHRRLFEHYRLDEGDTRFANSVPMGRVAEPEEIARAILFLASDDSSYITGHALVANGGRSTIV